MRSRFKRPKPVRLHSRDLGVLTSSESVSYAHKPMLFKRPTAGTQNASIDSINAINAVQQIIMYAGQPISLHMCLMPSSSSPSAYLAAAIDAECIVWPSMDGTPSTEDVGNG